MNGTPSVSIPRASTPIPLKNTNLKNEYAIPSPTFSDDFPEENTRNTHMPYYFEYCFRTKEAIVHFLQLNDCYSVDVFNLVSGIQFAVRRIGRIASDSLTPADIMNMVGTSGVVACAFTSGLTCFYFCKELSFSTKRDLNRLPLKFSKGANGFSFLLGTSSQVVGTILPGNQGYNRTTNSIAGVLIGVSSLFGFFRFYESKRSSSRCMQQAKSWLATVSQGLTFANLSSRIIDLNYVVKQEETPQPLKIFQLCLSVFFMMGCASARCLNAGEMLEGLSKRVAFLNNVLIQVTFMLLALNTSEEESEILVGCAAGFIASSFCAQMVYYCLKKNSGLAELTQESPLSPLSPSSQFSFKI